MAATITPEVIRDSEAEVGARGMSLVRSFYLEGLASAASGAPHMIWHEVITALDAYGVGYGRTFPDDPSLICTRVRPVPFANSKTQARAVAYYMPASLVGIGKRVVRWRSWTERVLTSRFPDKTLIYTKYKLPGTNETIPQLARLPSFKALGQLIFEEETTSDPEPRLAVVNKLNSNSYRGQPKWTWHNAGVDIDPIGGGRYRLLARFDYDQETFIVPSFYVDPATGQVPDGILSDSSGKRGTYNKDGTEGNGWANNLLQDDLDFGRYGF